jgi:uncharacterized protein YbjQ (UPF0145 family)
MMSSIREFCVQVYFPSKKQIPFGATPMKTAALVLFAALFMFSAAHVQARDTRHQLPLADVLRNPEYASQLQGVQFFFADQQHPAVAQNFGEWKTNKKTNAFGKSDEFACQWAMLSALLQLHQRALDLGGDAVIDIRSNYKNREFSSQTHFECGAGGLMAGVALKGTVVKLN